MALDAVARVVEIVLEEGGEPADTLRAALRGMAPDHLRTLARIAADIDGTGNRTEIAPDVRNDARRWLIDRGWVTVVEFRTLSPTEIVERVMNRAREAGASPGPQA